jgi:hypothetical protein
MLRDLTISQVIACHDNILEITGKPSGKVMFLPNRATLRTLPAMPEPTRSKISRIAEDLDVMTKRSEPLICGSFGSTAINLPGLGRPGKDTKGLDDISMP